MDPSPPWLKDFAIATSGTADKIALFVGMGLVLTAVCALGGGVGAPRGDGSTGRRTVPSTVRRRCWACWSGSAC